MGTFFIQTLNKSITAGYCILLITIVRLLLKRQPKIYSYILWSIPFIRLICPFSLQSFFSFVKIHRQVIPQEIAMQTTPEINSGIEVLDHTINHAIASSSLIPEASQSVNPLQVVLTAVSAIWLVGIAGILLYSVIAAWKLNSRLKAAAKREQEEVSYPILEADGLPTAFVFGIFHPAIYLPAGLSEQEREYVLFHELTHIRRRDYLIKIIALFITAIHWFNPLVWAAYVMMESDMEMSCDESVIRRLGKGAKKEYSEALLSLASEHRFPQGSPLSFGEGKVSGRVRNILRYKKRTLAVTAVLVVFVAVVAAGLLTDRPERTTFLLSNPAYGNTGTSQTADGGNLNEETYRLMDGVVVRNLFSPNLTTDTDDPMDSDVNDLDAAEISLDSYHSIDEFLITYATAFCNRDGNQIAELYNTPETALQYGYEMSLVNGDTYTFGISSPWPWDTDYRILNYIDEGRAEIYYYAQTSDPTITVWIEKVNYTNTAGDYRITSSELKQYDTVTSLEEFGNAYFICGLYHFADLTEIVSAIRYQKAHDHESKLYENFLQPDTAAEYILHLNGGKSTVEKTAEHQALVTYTFADGGRVEIPMYQPDVGEDTEVSAGFDIWTIDFLTWNGVTK